MKKMLARFFTPQRVGKLMGRIAAAMEPTEALKYLFALDKELYTLEGRTSVRYGNGVHSKHRHIKYHDFFINNLAEGQKVLDIGCGNGVLDKAIADNIERISVVGIELNEKNVEWAKKNSVHPNITFINADVLTYALKEKFDVVILSNVLEHIERRVEFLKKVKEKCQPEYFLIRVPMYERDWRIPLQDELGLNYFLDSTHFIEYKIDELHHELAAAGLEIEKLQTNWGEYWLKAVCQK
ncbi:MAG: methyltransferase domain-containing protein [Patescibacteria group bacterium]